MNTKLYVDDLRPLPDNSWDVARSFHEAIVMLETGRYDHVSLDHDIASFYGYKELTGRDILNWLIFRKQAGQPVPTTVVVHSANPVAQNTMAPDCARYFSID
jgi:hypothetical protein